MKEKKITWHKIADSINEIQFGENNIGLIEIRGKKICLAKFRNNLFAFTYKCPHAGGILADGYIDLLGNVVCPMHRYKYDLRNGRNSSGEGYYLKNWPIQLLEDGVYIGLEPQPGFWNLLG